MVGLQDRMAAAATALGVNLPAEQSARLLAYLELLSRWNRTYNLTSVRDPDAMLTQHVVDCLAVVPSLRRELDRMPKPVRLLDVGSGGGLPGVVLAITEPALSVTCVDSVGKKAAFVQQVVATLQLSNLSARHARVEDVQEPFDIVTSRAFASLADFVRLTRARLSLHGIWMAMKGHVPTQEIAALPEGIDVFHVEPLDVPGLDGERCLVWMRPGSGRADSLIVSASSLHSSLPSSPS